MDYKERISRSILVDGYEQEKFLDVVVLLVGAGGIGSWVGLGLMAYLIKKIYIVDFDDVDESNMNRQLVFTNDDIGFSKAESLMMHMKERNVRTILVNLQMKIKNESDLFFLKEKPDVIFTCLDNVEGRLLLNDYAVKNKIPLINGGTSEGIYGEVSTVIAGKTPCLRCYKNVNKKAESCSSIKDASIVSTTMNISALMLAEFEKIIMGKNIIPAKLEYSMGRQVENENENVIPQPFYFSKRKRLNECICSMNKR